MDYFTQEEYLQSAKQQKKALAIFLICLGVYLVISVGILLFYIFLPYGSSLTVVVRIAEYGLTLAMVIFSFIYLGIPYKRVNNYNKLCKNMLTGKKEKAEGVLIEQKEEIQIKNGVDMKALIFLTYNEIKQDYFERKVLVFYEKPFPPIDLNDRVSFITQGNVLISYEILEKAQIDEEEIGEENESDSNGDR